jgi:hypothetical protein
LKNIIGVLNGQVLFLMANNCKYKVKARPFSFLTLNVYAPAHSLDNFLADAET